MRDLVTVSVTGLILATMALVSLCLFVISIVLMIVIKLK